MRPQSFLPCSPSLSAASLLALIALGTSSVVSLPAAAEDPCADIIRDTVAEMRAGADGWWGDDVESIVRAAAGSACVKARSDRYLAAESKPRSPAAEASVSAPRAETAQNAEGVPNSVTSEVQDLADADADADADSRCR
jgi:hypothetical protein